MSTIVVGIDPSLSNTGLCRVVNGTAQAWTTVSTAPDVPWPARLKTLRDQVQGFIMRSFQRGDTLLVAMESQIFLSQHLYADAAAVHGLFQLTIWETFALRGAPGETSRFLSVNPAHVKKWLGAKQKDEILLQVFKRYGREFRDHNQADAFTVAAIGECWLHYATEPSHLWPEMTKPQAEVLDKLMKSGLPWEPAPPKPKKAKEKRGKA